VITVQDVVNQNIEILRARAERYRRLAEDLFDPRTSEEAASLAQELDAEIARLQTQPQISAMAH
jgi:plasmid stabilization system protein ParE